MDIMERDTPQPVVSMATLLWVVSRLYSGVMRLRRRLYEKKFLRSERLPCPVVSVGNLTLGGTGKTPMVVHLAKFISRMGYKVAIISRGYRGLAQNSGTIVTDGQTPACTVRQSGDEPYLMAILLEDEPVVVGKDRHAAGKVAVDRFRPDLILLDDAFQHLRLERDLDLLLLDARSPFGNSRVLPRGR